MRILLVSDIHANWPALQAIQEPHDLCLCLGDLVDYGLEPAPCIRWVRQHAQYVIRGNHDHGVAQNVVVNGQSGFKYLTGVTRPFTRRLLGPDDLRFLGSLPVTLHLTLDNLRFLLVHATPRDPLDEYAQADPQMWARRLEGVDADVICVAHTHVPYWFEIGDKLVINPGSVGLPRDGNPRASYAVLEGRNVELKRIDYPVEASVAVIQQSALPDDAKNLLTEVYRTGEVRKAPRPDTKVVAPGAQGGSKMIKPAATSSQLRPRTEAQAATAATTATRTDSKMLKSVPGTPPRPKTEVPPPPLPKPPAEASTDEDDEQL